MPTLRNEIERVRKYPILGNDLTNNNKKNRLLFILIFEVASGWIK